MSPIKFRLWPRALAGQIAAYVIVALVISQTVTGLLAVALTPHGPPPAFPPETAARVALILDLLDVAPAPQRASIMAAAGRENLDITADDGGAVVPGTDGSATARDFDRMIGERLHTPFPLQLSEDKATAGENRRVVVRARLGDGSIVRIATTIMPPPNVVDFSVRSFLLYLPFLALLLGVLTIWATQRVTAPLRDFADAAERLGNERSAPPLAERGPAELQRAARSFNKMQDQVKRFVEERTRMLAAISHDMRTPITRLRLRVETAVDDETEQRKMLQDLDRMDTMIGSTLSFLRDGTRDEAVELVDLASLLQSVCDDFSDMGCDIRYVGASNLFLRCRPAMVGRAITNLAENATKFAGTTTVDLISNAGGNALIHIDDHGPGIPDAEKTRAFDPFYRLDPARNADTGGVGLGLSIAKSIIESHRGTIELIDRMPTGLRVAITLPAAA